LRVNDVTQARLEKLAEKANAGTLEYEDSAEYDEDLAMFHLVTIMQAKARRLLQC
jgi:hypothetical protein